MLENLLRQSEGKTLEFKENLKSLPSVIKTIIAFANTAGGIIVVGIEDKTKGIVGIANPLAEEERLASAISDTITPLLMPDMETQTFRNKEILIIRVPHMVGPYYIKFEGLEKSTYVRLGSTNRIADYQTLEALKYLSKNTSFDEIPCIQSTKESLNWTLITQTFQTVGKNISEQKAKILGIIVDHANRQYPSCGGILLFGSNRFERFPDSMVRCARFATNTREKIIDQLDITIDLTASIAAIISFIERNTSIRLEIGRTRSTDIREYPPEALREAATNAVLHTDYAIKGSSILIAIFQDRIEFTNPGALPFGLSLKHALAGSSRLRNRVIGKVFRELRLIEQWGSGLQRIIETCLQRGLKPPKFEELGNQFRLTIYNSPIEIPFLEPWKKKLLDHLLSSKEINTKQAAALWEVTTRTASARLKQLLGLGLVSKIATSAKDPLGVFVLSSNILCEK